MMNHTPVSSSLISSVGYDTAERVLELVLRFGTYRYYDVPIGVYRELLAAPSKGKYFHRHIAGSFSTSPHPATTETAKPTLNLDNLAAVLAKYVPALALESVTDLIVRREVQIVITRSRATKLGDYNNPRRSGFYKISINHNLNPFRFLITLLHEIAHLDTWNEYRNTVSSHGYEWKKSFRNLAMPFIESGVFPSALAEILRTHLRNPSYASCVDHKLERALKPFDGVKSTTPLEQLPYAAVFKLSDGLLLRKERLLRKRFVCAALDSSTTYRVSALAEVHPTDDPLTFDLSQPVPNSLELFAEACRWNRIDLVKKLLAQGIDARSAVPNGKTAARIAFENEHFDLLLFLTSIPKKDSTEINLICR